MTTVYYITPTHRHTHDSTIAVSCIYDKDAEHMKKKHSIDFLTMHTKPNWQCARVIVDKVARANLLYIEQTASAWKHFVFAGNFVQRLETRRQNVTYERLRMKKYTHYAPPLLIKIHTSCIHTAERCLSVNEFIKNDFLLCTQRLCD